MENVIDIRTALEQLGTAWQFGGSVTAGTQEAWDTVTWEDPRDKPTWAELCTTQQGRILMAALSTIEAEYELKFDDLRKAQASAMLIGGDSLVTTLAQLSAKWAELAEKCDMAINNKIDELTEVQNG